MENLFITLSAKALCPMLLVVARDFDDAAAKKLRLAGADRVVQPSSSAGLQMANLIAKPRVAAGSATRPERSSSRRVSTTARSTRRRRPMRRSRRATS
ncbi:MAG: NAD-binding protein [Actinobacteria bacterium]|nr:NAD-binding protein [Actinomycetota bacterium]